MMWSILSDMDPARQAAAVLLQLRGAAAEFVQDMPAQAILYGGFLNGAQVDPMTYLMHALGEKYAQLGEEVRLTAITDFLNFSRGPQEHVDELLARFDTVRQ